LLFGRRGRHKQLSEPDLTSSVEFKGNQAESHGSDGNIEKAILSIKAYERDIERERAKQILGVMEKGEEAIME